MLTFFVLLSIWSTAFVDFLIVSSLSADYRYDFELHAKNESLVQKSGLNYDQFFMIITGAAKITFVDLSNRGDLSEKDFVLLSNLSNLRWLNLRNTNTTDKMFSNLGPVKTLVSVDDTKTRMTTKATEAFKKRFSLTFETTSADTKAKLDGLKKLEQLLRDKFYKDKNEKTLCKSGSLRRSMLAQEARAMIRIPAVF